MATINELDERIRINGKWVKKPKDKKTNDEWLSNFVVGEEVLISGKYSFDPNIKGIIAKINKKSVSVKLFAYEEIVNEKDFENHAYGYNKLIWETYTNDSKVIFNKNKIIKKGEQYDEEFIEGKRGYDYGR